MGGASIWHWLVVGLVVMLLFGRGKISEMMGDVAKGIKAFKKGMADDDSAAATTTTPAQPVAADPLRSLDHRPADAAAAQPATNTTFGQNKAG